MSNGTMFLGGLSGTGKTSGKPFYCLNFAVPSDRDNVFGYEHASVFVKAEEFEDFKKAAKPGVTYPNILLHYARGGWDLISYKF